ncbi:Uncharacterised protein [uncultured archaeon]|nr:Uncharacterised protein [uncultured archaeon]
MKSKSGFCYLAVFAILAILIAAPLVKVVNAATNSSTVTVNINISQVGSIVVQPSSLTWTGVNPGSDTATQNLIIRNTGSMNLSLIYMNTSTVGDESPNPLQIANATYYSAAGLIFVKNSTDSSYYHAGRLEWNLSTVLTGETLSLAGATQNFSHGWYRNNTGNEYLWKLENGTAGFCNNKSSTVLTIITQPENSSALRRDFSGTYPTATCTSSSDNANWAVFTCTNGPLTGQCIATPKDCSKIFIYKYNYAADYPTCNSNGYLRNGNLIPGDETSISVFASIPQGIPAGDTKTGTLTVIATY